MSVTHAYTDPTGFFPRPSPSGGLELKSPRGTGGQKVIVPFLVINRKFTTNFSLASPKIATTKRFAASRLKYIQRTIFDNLSTYPAIYKTSLGAISGVVYETPRIYPPIIGSVRE